MINTNIVIPTWVEVIDADFYNSLVRNVAYFNANNSIVSIIPIPPAVDPAAVWLGLFNSLVTQLGLWRTVDRGWTAMIYALMTVGFDLSAFSEAEVINYYGKITNTDLTNIDSDVALLMEQTKFKNIFNFQGLVQESKTWSDSHILNNNDSSVLASIVSKISGSAEYENTLVETLTQNMTFLLQSRALNKMLETDPSKQIYFDFIQALPLYLINTGGYPFPSQKP